MTSKGENLHWNTTKTLLHFHRYTLKSTCLSKKKTKWTLDRTGLPQHQTSLHAQSM